MQHSPKPEFSNSVKTRVQVDDRESHSQTLAALRNRDDVDVEVKRLRLGDYLVDCSLIVERKSVRDLVRSVHDARLFRQASRLSSSNMRVCLIIEGATPRLPRLRLSRASIQGVMVSLTMVYGLPVLRSRSPEETVFLMLTAARQLHRRARHYPKRVGEKTARAQRCQLLMLQCIPDIGPRRAKKILEAFGNLAGLLSSPKHELESVSGIGARTVERLWAVLHWS